MLGVLFSHINLELAEQVVLGDVHGHVASVPIQHGEHVDVVGFNPAFDFVHHGPVLVVLSAALVTVDAGELANFGPLGSNKGKILMNYQQK